MLIKGLLLQRAGKWQAAGVVQHVADGDRMRRAFQENVLLVPLRDDQLAFELRQVFYDREYSNPVAVASV